MKDELQEHKMSDKIKWICTLIEKRWNCAGRDSTGKLVYVVGVAEQCFVGVLLIGIICGWFEKKDDEPTDVVESGIAVTLPESNGVKLTKTMLTAAQYDAYGISPQAESAFTITANGLCNDVYNRNNGCIFVSERVQHTDYSNVCFGNG